MFRKKKKENEDLENVIEVKLLDEAADSHSFPEDNEIQKAEYEDETADGSEEESDDEDCEDYEDDDDYEEDEDPNDPLVKLKRAKKRIRYLRIWIVFDIVLALAAGWAVGTFYPLPGTSPLIDPYAAKEALNGTKIGVAMDVMQNDWYFGSDIDDLRTRLTDQALKGIFSNEEDIHTEYMTKSEVVDFQNSINRNFVGIGVEFASAQSITLVTRVFPGSPAEKAGLLPGDIIELVNGESIQDLTSEEIKERVRGESGTALTVSITRDGKSMDIVIKRAPITVTVFGYPIDETTGYLQIYQFGGTTDSEIEEYLKQFKEAGIQKLVLDLRDNGGGFLESLEGVTSLFLPEGSLIMTQEFTDKTINKVFSGRRGTTYDFSPVSILVNEETASASEVFILAMRENRDDVTLVGTQTYGKGTVQVTNQFNDGSALKYTTSKWLSSKGEWINNVGVTPDIEVEKPEGVSHEYAGMNIDSVPLYSVDDAVKDVQIGLKYLDYEIDRTDGYFSDATMAVIRQFEADHSMDQTDSLTKAVYEAVISEVTVDWNTTEKHDTQLQEALAVLNQ